MRKTYTFILLLFGLLFYTYGQIPAYEKYYYSSTNQDEGFTLVEKPDGNFWAIGHSQSAVSSEPCGVGMIVIPTDSRGNPSAGFKVQAGSYTRLFKGIYTSDGNILLIGEPMCIIKVDTTGIVQWYKYYRHDTISGYEFDGIGVTESGGDYYHTYRSSLAGQSFLVKTDAAGNKLWHKAVGGGAERTMLGDVLPDGAGGVYCIANVSHPGVTSRVQLSRFNADGTTAFVTEYPIEGEVISMVRNAVGDLVVATWLAHSQIALGLDNAGNVKWYTKVTMPGSSPKYFQDMAPGVDGGVALVGKYGAIQYEQGFVYTLDSDGKYVWGKSYGTPGKSENSFNAVLGSHDCGYVLNGRAEDSLSYYVHWMMKVDATGNCTYPGDSVPISSIVYSPVPAGVSGYINYRTNLLLDASLTLSKLYHGVVQHNKTSGFSSATCTPVSQDPVRESEPVTLSPNPSQDIVRISVPQGWTNWSVTIADLQGRTVFEENNIGSEQFSLDLARQTFHSGLYLVKLQCKGEIRTLRLVKD